MTQVQTGLSAAERIFALIDSKHSVNQTGQLEVQALKGKIDFNNLGFSYATGSPVLENFDLHIKPGENVAIVGHTGAGKSSIARLVARFYEFQKGELLIDDINIREFDLTSLRMQMGIVNQVPFLLKEQLKTTFASLNQALVAMKSFNSPKRLAKGNGWKPSQTGWTPR